ncbi:unnamed protein product [Closterium sp. NIES-54]
MTLSTFPIILLTRACTRTGWRFASLLPLCASCGGGCPPHSVLNRVACCYPHTTVSCLSTSTLPLQVLAPLLDGALPLSCPSVQAVVGDALDVLSCKEMRPGTGKAAGAEEDGEEEAGGSAGGVAGGGGGGGGGRAAAGAGAGAGGGGGGGAGALANALKGRVVTQLMKKNLVENTIPVLIELKRLLEAQNSPLQGALMACLRCLFKEYKEEIEDLLAADPQLGKELVYDIQKHEAARARAAAANRAAGSDSAGGVGGGVAAGGVGGGGGSGGEGKAAAAAASTPAAVAACAAEAADAAGVVRDEGEGEEGSGGAEAGARRRRKSAEFQTPTKDKNSAGGSDDAAAVGTPAAAAVAAAMPSSGNAATASASAGAAAAAAAHSNGLSASTLCSPLFVTPNPPSRTRSRSRSRLGDERFGRSGLAGTEEEGEGRGEEEEEEGEEQREEERARAAVQAAATAAAIIRDVEGHGNKTPILRTVSVPKVRERRGVGRGRVAQEEDGDGVGKGRVSGEGSMGFQERLTREGGEVGGRGCESEVERRTREREEGESEEAGMIGKEDGGGRNGRSKKKGVVMKENDQCAALEKGSILKGRKGEEAADGSRQEMEGSWKGGCETESAAREGRGKGYRGVVQGDEGQGKGVRRSMGEDLPPRRATRQSARVKR